MWKKGDYYGVVAQAQDMVPGFKEDYRKFEQQVVLRGLSKGLLENYGRNVAHPALHFGCCPECVSVEEINCYLYHRAVNEKVCESYMKHTVFGVRMWLRLYGKDDVAIRIPVMKKTQKLPEVLSKGECRELFKAPKSFKHRFLLAFAYSTGMRLNELRFVKISDIDTGRMQVRVRQGKGKKDRYIVLSQYIKTKLPNYLESCRPEIYLFEGSIPGHEMGERSIQNVMMEAVKKTNMMKPQFEIADIIRRYKRDLYSGNNVLEYHKRVLNALENCRTSALGGHVEQCDECGEIRISYNSCRNRHCPKCQGAERDRRIESRLSEALDCKYFHNVFTIPECLNYYCLHYPRQMYNLLFQSSKDTLECFGKDEKYLGAEIGCIGILHTWGQKPDLHPHVHYIVPAGGIDKTGNRRHTRNEGKYLFPVKAMSAVFRGKFVTLFREFLESKNIEFSEDLRRDIYKRDWVVYAKCPFGGASQVIEYLGRYTHKIAVSNHRIESVDEGKVAFNYKDYGDEGKVKTMTLSASEFLRRFCLHILPKGFRKIRHYGILSSRNKKNLREMQTKIGAPELKTDAIVYIKPDFKVKSCPCCGKGGMHIIMSFGANAPPSQDVLNELKNINLNSTFP